jgi:hypothetical protein
MAFWDRVRDGMRFDRDRDRDRDDRWREDNWSGRDRDYDRPYDRGYGTDYGRSMGADRDYGSMSRDRDYGNRDYGRSSGTERDYGRSMRPDRERERFFTRDSGGSDRDREDYAGRYSMYGDTFGQGYNDRDFDRSGAGAGYASSRWGVEGSSSSERDRWNRGRNEQTGSRPDFDRYSSGRSDYDRSYRGSSGGSDFDRGRYGYGGPSSGARFEGSGRSTEGRYSGGSYGRGNYDRTDFDNDYDREDDRDRWGSDEWDRNRNRW